MEFVEQSLKDLSYKYKFLEYFIGNSNGKEEFTNCLVRIYNSKSEGEIKQASRDLVHFVEEKTGFCSEYYKPIIWTNSALESKKSLKHAALMMYREGYSSDEYDEHADDVFKFLEDMSLKMLLHKKKINELNPEDNLWRVAYEEPSKFYGFLLGAELWMDMMPQNAFRRLRLSYQEDGCKDATTVSLSSEVFNDLLILATKKLKEIEPSLDDCGRDSFDFLNFTKDEYISFRNDSTGMVTPIKISDIYKNISSTNLETLGDRLGFLRDIFRAKSTESIPDIVILDSDTPSTFSVQPLSCAPSNVVKTANINSANFGKHGVLLANKRQSQSKSFDGIKRV